MCKLCISNVNELYSKDPELNKKDIAILQEWMDKEAHLPKISEFQMICFLSSCYYSLEATKVCIENYYTLRTHVPEIFSGRNFQDESLKYHINTVLVRSLPKLTKDNYQIIYAKLHNLSTEKYNFNESLRVAIIGLILNNIQNGPQKGHILMIDGAGLQLGHILKMHIMMTKKFFFFLQEAQPIRLKRIHVLNVNPITEKFLNLIKPTLKKELVDQIHCHSKIETVYEFVSKEALPKDYGGDIGTIEKLLEENIENINNHIEMLVLDETFKSDESKRRVMPKNLEELFGIVGTFKKLNFD